ncbi:Spo0E family sporulation regulatory protein-aspartic acid phosphatase [Neobacillus pocheonensis]|uniref:Spo0E family sporulation regulatory protein-aspartic acid phosphatase n=1 Tax=Neobacillus pocheonensis TaxID=363869 RepID=A0ABT0WFB4_9BACI|nr:Spo0E family sporulation regulatory protein-aspartic acid phosphatase [Neobacillus pocheonensis]
MFLKYALDLRKSIEKYRRDLYELAKSKGIYDPEVKKIVKELDGKIMELKEVLSEIPR